MKTKTVIAAMMAVSFVSVAFADGTTLTWNGADGASWNGDNWLNGETPSAWIDGSSVVFPVGATVALGGKVSVSNITTSGSLAVAGSAGATYSGYLSTTPVLTFPGLTLDDLDNQPLSALMGGTYASGSASIYAKAYHYTRSGNTATAQFQMAYNGHLRCIRVVFSENTDGVYAKVDINNSYYVMKDNSGASYLGWDIDTIDPSIVGKTYLQTSDSGQGVGIKNLCYYPSRIDMTGEASFGGALTLSKASLEVTSALSHVWGNAVVCDEGYLIVKGASSATVDTTYGIAGNTGTGESYAWLTANASDTVFTNMVLSRTEPVSAIAAGDLIGFVAIASPYHVKSDGQTMTLQFQYANSGSTYIKGIKVELKQSGANVTARFVQSYYHVGGTLGEDMENTSGVVTGTAAGNNYVNPKKNGIRSMVLRTVRVPSLTLSGAGSDIDEIAADNAQLVIVNASARPWRLVAKNSSQVDYSDGTGDKAGAVRMFESGSVFMPTANVTTESNARYVFDGAKLRTTRLHPTQKDGCNYINYMTLANGAFAEAYPVRCGFGNSGGKEMLYKSTGTGPNIISSGIALVNNRINNSGTYSPNLDNPNTLVIDASANLEISGPLRNYNEAGYNGTRVVKRGAATLTLSGENGYDGRFTLEAGTLELASDTALPAAAPLTLAGGTVSCGSSTNEAGALTLSGDATIDLGDGSLSFADSSGETWAAGATLNITGPEGWPVRSVRFGTNGAGLTAAQLSRIRYNGSKVSLTGEGYLGGPKGLTISFY